MTLRCDWSHDGAQAFAQASAELDLKGATVDDVALLVNRMPMMTFYADQQPIGGAVLHNETVHIGIQKEYRGRWLNKAVLRGFREMLGLAKSAAIAQGNERAQQFARKCGWRATRKEGAYVVYQP